MSDHGAGVETEEVAASMQARIDRSEY